MTMQTLFKNLGPNWKYASVSNSGSVRVHTERPSITIDGVLVYKLGREHTCKLDDQTRDVPPEGLIPQIWERTDFTNGPNYATDAFGIALSPPVPQVLTVDEAENGSLWGFARNTENYVSVNSFGVVWFNTFKDGPEPRRSYAVEVTGVPQGAVIERIRCQPVSPPEAGTPYVDKYDAPKPEVAKHRPTGKNPDIDDNYPRLPEMVSVFNHGGVVQYGAHTYVWYDEAEQVAGAASTLDEAIRQQQAYSNSLEGDRTEEGIPDLGEGEALALNDPYIHALERKAKKLRKVKNKARKLTLEVDEHGRQQLSLVQYMAIFG